MTFAKLTTFNVAADGHIERRSSEIPSVVGCPTLRVTVPADADRHVTIRLLRRLADELEAMP